MATYLEQSLSKLEEFEGAIPWMYRDTVGKVTVGVGLMLPDADAAVALPFQLGTRAATAAEIAAEFQRVDQLPMGRAAHFYQRAEGLQLPQAEVAALLQKVLVGFEATLRGRLGGYDTYPDGVKMALLDMAYNLGPEGLLHGFPRLIKAVEAGEWAQAASVCFRHGPGAARNTWTREMFLSSVVASVKAVGESSWQRLGYGLLGLAVSLFDPKTRSK